MKLTQRQLRGLIREEVRRAQLQRLAETVQRLDELYPGSNLGSYLKQGVSKLWEADNLFVRALSEAPDDQTWNVVNDIHKALEKMAFDADGKMQSIVADDIAGKR